MIVEESPLLAGEGHDLVKRRPGLSDGRRRRARSGETPGAFRRGPFQAVEHLGEGAPLVIPQAEQHARRARGLTLGRGKSWRKRLQQHRQPPDHRGLGAGRFLERPTIRRIEGDGGLGRAIGRDEDGPEVDGRRGQDQARPDGAHDPAGGRFQACENGRCDPAHVMAPC